MKRFIATLCALALFVAHAAAGTFLIDPYKFGGSCTVSALTFTESNSAVDSVTGTTLAIGSITASVGDVVEVKIAADNSGTNGASSISSVTDSAGNTYAPQTTQNNDPGAADAGTTFAIYTSTITNALSGGTMTVNFSPTTTKRAAQVTRIQPGAGNTVAIISASGTTGTATSYAAPTVSVTNGDTISAGAGVEHNLAGVSAAGDSDTTNGNWSTVWQTSTSGGGSTSNQSVMSQRKTVNATGNQSWAASSTASADYGAGYVIYRPSC